MNKQLNKSKMISTLLQDLVSWSTKTSTINPDNKITNRVVQNEKDILTIDLGKWPTIWIIFTLQT